VVDSVHYADLVVVEVLTTRVRARLNGTARRRGTRGIQRSRGDEAGEGVMAARRPASRRRCRGRSQVIEERDHAAWIEVADVEIDDSRALRREKRAAAPRRRGS
jgi:hypothetical protein